MPDSVPAATAAQLDDPFAELGGRWRGRPDAAGGRGQYPAHPAHAAAGADRARARRPDLAARPGRHAAGRGGRQPPGPAPVHDPGAGLPRQRLTLDIVRHGDGPGERWVRSAQPGDTIEGIAPRGKIFVAGQADWHVFAADESALAAVLAMTGSLPADGRAAAILEIPEPADEQRPNLPAGVRLSWLPRDGLPAGDPAALSAELQRPSCRPAAATSTCSARPGWSWRCARCSPPAASPASRSRPRPTGAGARPTPSTASPPATADRRAPSYPAATKTRPAGTHACRGPGRGAP